MIGLKVEGARELVLDIKRDGQEVRKGLVKGLFKAAMIIRSAAVRGISKPPKTGRIYKRRSVVHRASAKGEYPAGDTGNLSRTINAVIDPVQIESRVEAAANYAIPLELKPPERGGRPFLSRAYDENEKLVTATIRDAVNDALAAADRKATRR